MTVRLWMLSVGTRLKQLGRVFVIEGLADCDLCQSVHSFIFPCCGWALMGGCAGGVYKAVRAVLRLTF